VSVTTPTSDSDSMSSCMPGQEAKVERTHTKISSSLISFTKTKRRYDQNAPLLCAAELRSLKGPSHSFHRRLTTPTCCNHQNLAHCCAQVNSSPRFVHSYTQEAMDGVHAASVEHEEAVYNAVCAQPDVLIRLPRALRTFGSVLCPRSTRTPCECWRAS
jgi:hypothetical protein